MRGERFIFTENWERRPRGLFFGTWGAVVKAEAKDVRRQTSGLERREYGKGPEVGAWVRVQTSEA